MISTRDLLEFVKRAGTPPPPPPPQQSPGNQAMAAAAQMAAPPGAPSMPKAIEPQQQPQGADPNAVQQAVAEKDKEIANLQGQLNEVKLEVEKERNKAEIQAEQRKAEDKLRSEQAALDKKRTESAAAEERHRANLERETARQQMQVAKAEADATVSIAQRDADSVKATADANAKEYVRMTEAARKDVDSYRASQQAAVDKYTQEARKNNPYVSVGLQNQLDSALAAAHNVSKLRTRLAKKASSAPPAPQPSPVGAPVKAPAPAQQPPQQPAQPQPPPQQPAQPAPPQQPVQPQRPAPAQQPPQQPAQPQQPVSDEQAAIAARNEIYRKKAQEKINADHKLARIGDKVSMQGNLVNRHKEILAAEGKLNNLKQYNGDPAEIQRWQEALDTARKAKEGYELQLRERAEQGDAKAQEELAQLKDFTQQRQTSGGATFLNVINPLNLVAKGARLFGAEGLARGVEEVGSFGLSDYKSEADEYAAAVARGLTPEQMKAQDKGFWSGITSFITDPFVSMGNAINDYDRSRQLAANRGIDMQWFDSDYSGAAGDAYEEALKQRNLNGTVFGNAGNIGLNAGVAALDLAGNVAMATGVGAGLGAGLKGMAALGRGISVANKAYKAGKLGSAALRAGRHATRNVWKDMGRRAAEGTMNGKHGLLGKGYQQLTSGLNKFNRSNIGKATNTLGWGTMIGGGAAMGGQLAGTDKFNFLDPHIAQQRHNSNPYAANSLNQVRVLADGSMVDAVGNYIGQYTDSAGNQYGYDQYKQLNPNYVQMMNDPLRAGQLAGMAKTASSWAGASQNPMINPDTPYTSTGLGKLLAFASPHVSGFSKGKLSLAPSVAAPIQDLMTDTIDPGATTAAFMQQTANPLFNADASNRGMIKHLMDMRRSAVAHPMFSFAGSEAPLYNQMMQ